ncbi:MULTISPECIES: hypothetical protein [Streptomyces]|uniref:hypothetical protein n=1 Tax=Streptomyces TaxID=1883 RepID=UPI000F511DF5|nr:MULTISPECIES: hypothetical protein [Streptomyces]
MAPRSTLYLHLIGERAPPPPPARALLYDLGYEDLDSLGNRLVDAIVAHGTAEDIARRVREHLDAAADHVSLHLLTTTPRRLAHPAGA